MTVPIEPWLDKYGIVFREDKTGNQPIHWLPVPGHPNYAVSGHGDVLSMASGKPRFLACAPNVWGYPRVTLSSREAWLVHRLVLTVFVGPPPPGRPEGAHRNGVKTDNRLGNLYWASASDNGADNARLGVLKGTKHPMAKLTDQTVREIRAAYSAGEGSLQRLADRFGVSFHTVQRVCSGKGWSHVA